MPCESASLARTRLTSLRRAPPRQVDRRPKEFSAENQSTLKWAKRRLKSVYNSKPQLEPGYLRRTQSYTQSDYASKVAEARQRRISSIADWYADETVYDYYSEEWGDVWW